MSYVHPHENLLGWDWSDHGSRGQQRPIIPHSSWVISKFTTKIQPFHNDLRRVRNDLLEPSENFKMGSDRVQGFDLRLNRLCLADNIVFITPKFSQRKECWSTTGVERSVSNWVWRRRCSWRKGGLRLSQLLSTGQLYPSTPNIYIYTCTSNVGAALTNNL